MMLNLRKEMANFTFSQNFKVTLKESSFLQKDFSICELRKAMKAYESLVSFNSVFLFHLRIFLLKYKAGGPSLYSILNVDDN